MSATKRGAGQRKVITWLKHSVATAFGLLLADLKIAVAQIKARRQEEQRINNLRGLSDHALRDIGLLRDRHSGTILNDMSGEVLNRETRRSLPFAGVSSDQVSSLHLGGIERRQFDRRIGERRHAERHGVTGRHGCCPEQDYSGQDRRAFERRSRDHQVLDCRRFFPGRSGFMLA